MENKNEVQELAQVNVQVNTQKSVPESAKANEKKRALLVISFGTSYPETRKKTIDAIEEEIRQAFPEYDFFRAFTSPTIMRIMREREGIWVDDVEQAFERLLAEGYKEVLVQMTHVIRGFEYDRMMGTIRRYQDRFQWFACGEPLLTDEKDYQRLAEILENKFAEYRVPGAAVVLMGHGTEHVANFSYERLQKHLTDDGAGNLLIGTVEASPTLDSMMQAVEDQKPKRVLLAPLLIVAGNHVMIDMAGDQEDSWKNQFLREGYEVECNFEGLGEYPEIRKMYVEHAKAAWKRAEEMRAQEERISATQMEMGAGDGSAKSGKIVPGILWGIGVGPGDPELLTLKAVRKIKECDVLMVPGEDYRSSIAYQIAQRAIPEVEKKPCVGVELPMTRDKERLAQAHETAAKQVMDLLAQGKQVGFLNLGDVTLYATYLYIHRLVQQAGYEARLINGIPSFCATAATLNVGLAENSEQLHVLSQPGQIEEGLKLPGTKVIMKMGKNLDRVKEIIAQSGMEAMMVENCGLPGEKICRSVDEIHDGAGYYSLVIVKEK